MGPVVTSLAFRPPPSTYNNNLKYLEFVTREEQFLSYITTHKIPIRYYACGYRKTILICHGNAEDIGQLY